MADDRIDDVLSYWFGGGAGAEAAMPERLRRWFRGGPEVDREIRERFGGDLERARRGELDAWADTPRGRLALVILLDQFSRNLHRGTGEAFAGDSQALELAVEGLDRGVDSAFDPFERMFFTLPLSHAEDLASQERAVRTCEAWAASLPPALVGMAKSALDQARLHRDVIARFGRFPTRNQALGRTSTPEESAHVEAAKAAGHPV